MNICGFRRRVRNNIRQGAKNRRRLTRLKGLKACCVIQGFSFVADAHPITWTSYFPERASVRPIFSYIRESSTGLSTEAMTSVLLLESAIQGYKGLTVNP